MNTFKHVEILEAPEPSVGNTKKRREQSFDESVDWLQRERERSSIAWLTNASHEREIFNIDVGDPLENTNSPSAATQRCGCQRDCQTGNRLKFPVTFSCLVNSYSSMRQ